MMPTSEESECSTSSEVLQGAGTPYSSPFQQVPGNSTPQCLTNLDDVSMHSDGDKPYLKILNQPEDQFRFRYTSEFEGNGSHGYIQGKFKFVDNMAKSCPSVELRNYSGKAVVKCQLYEFDKEVLHPHRLSIDGDSVVTRATVPHKGGYIVCFHSLGVIMTNKKNVPDLLYTRKQNSMSKAEFKKSKRKLRDECNKAAKSINLHKVRLRFSAHEVDTDQLICAPVYSDPILDKKSAETNELKICFLNPWTGSPLGGQPMVLLVEKISYKKGEIQVNVFNEDRSWVSHVPLTASNVHHQYGIMFRMPQYQRVDITHSVDVFIELHNKNDGRRSNPMNFKYIPDVIYERMDRAKKRKLDSTSQSSQSPHSTVSSPASSIPSVSDTYLYNCNNLQIPTSHTPNNLVADVYSTGQRNSGLISTTQVSNSYSQTNAQYFKTSAEYIEFETAFNEAPGSIVEEYFVKPTTGALVHSGMDTSSLTGNPLLSESSQHVVRNIPPYSQPNVVQEESDLQNYSDFIQDNENTSYLQEYLRDMDPLKADSGRRSVVKDACVKTEKKMKEEDAYFKPEDGLEVKKLIKEICALKKNKCATSVDDIKRKLERMFEIRMTNGDTFLHMALSSHQPTFNYIVETIDSVGVNYLLNEVNDLQQTILHLAVLHDMPKTVSYLIAKGCDPMVADSNGNTVVHYAVICRTALAALLEAMDKEDCKYNIDKINNKWQSPLMIAVLNDWETEARMLAEHGATIAHRKSESEPKSSSSTTQSSFPTPKSSFPTPKSSFVAPGSSSVAPESSFPTPKSSFTVPFTALHIAASAERSSMLQLLLNYVDKDNIDAVDWKGMTSLQAACARAVTLETRDIVRVLLEKGADPLRHGNGTKPAWRLARDKELMWEIVRQYLPDDIDVDEHYTDTSGDDDDTDDEYLSAESDSESDDTEDLTMDIESLSLAEDTTIGAVN